MSLFDAGEAMQNIQLGAEGKRALADIEPGEASIQPEVCPGCGVPLPDPAHLVDGANRDPRRLAR